jgi:hypothetical protein
MRLNEEEDKQLKKLRKARKIFVYRVANIRNGAKKAPVKLGAYMVHNTREWATRPINIFDLSKGDASFQWGIDLKLIETFDSLVEADDFVKKQKELTLC